jgi:hypothetical protein
MPILDILAICIYPSSLTNSMNKLKSTSTSIRRNIVLEYNVRNARDILPKWAFSVQTMDWVLWDLNSFERKPRTYAFDFFLRVGYGWMEEAEKTLKQ